jgi:hypothetical protein
VTIHLTATALEYIRATMPAAAGYREGGPLFGAPVVLEAEGPLPERSGYWQTDDGRRLEFVLDAAGIHPTVEAGGPRP